MLIGPSSPLCSPVRPGETTGPQLTLREPYDLEQYCAWKETLVTIIDFLGSSRPEFLGRNVTSIRIQATTEQERLHRLRLWHENLGSVSVERIDDGVEETTAALNALNDEDSSATSAPFHHLLRRQDSLVSRISSRGSGYQQNSSPSPCPPKGGEYPGAFSNIRRDSLSLSLSSHGLRRKQSVSTMGSAERLLTPLYSPSQTPTPTSSDHSLQTSPPQPYEVFKASEPSRLDHVKENSTNKPLDYRGQLEGGTASEATDKKLNAQISERSTSGFSLSSPRRSPAASNTTQPVSQTLKKQKSPVTNLVLCSLIRYLTSDFVLLDHSATDYAAELRASTQNLGTAQHTDGRQMSGVPGTLSSTALLLDLVCDGCLMPLLPDDGRVSSAFYRCISCLPYDEYHLCNKCESAGMYDHNPTHVWTKIKDVRQWLLYEKNFITSGDRVNLKTLVQAICCFLAKYQKRDSESGFKKSLSCRIVGTTMESSALNTSVAVPLHSMRPTSKPSQTTALVDNHKQHPVTSNSVLEPSLSPLNAEHSGSVDAMKGGIEHTSMKLSICQKADKNPSKTGSARVPPLPKFDQVQELIEKEGFSATATMDAPEMPGQGREYLSPTGCLQKNQPVAEVKLSQPAETQPQEATSTSRSLEAFRRGGLSRKVGNEIVNGVYENVLTLVLVFLHCVRDKFVSEEGYAHTTVDHRPLQQGFTSLLPPDVVKRETEAKQLCKDNVYIEARVLLDFVVEEKTRILGPEHPETLQSRADLGDIQLYLQNWDKALQIYDEVAPAVQKVFGVLHPVTQQVMDGRMVGLLQTGDTTQAEKLTDRYLFEFWEASAIAGERSIASIRTLMRLAYRLAVLKESKTKFGEALSLYDHIIKRLEPAYRQFNLVPSEDEIEVMLDSHHSQGKILEKLHKSAEAQEAYIQALQISRKLKGQDDPQSLAIAASLAKITPAPSAFRTFLPTERTKAKFQRAVKRVSLISTAFKKVDDYGSSLDVAPLPSKDSRRRHSFIVSANTLPSFGFQKQMGRSTFSKGSFRKPKGTFGRIKGTSVAPDPMSLQRELLVREGEISNASNAEHSQSSHGSQKLPGSISLAQNKALGISSVSLKTELDSLEGQASAQQSENQNINQAIIQTGQLKQTENQPLTKPTQNRRSSTGSLQILEGLALAFPEVHTSRDMAFKSWRGPKFINNVNHSQ